MNITRPQPRLYRLAFCAPLAGMTAESLLTACQLRQIPVTVHQIGVRGYWHLDAKEFVDWLGPAAPDALKNLF